MIFRLSIVFVSLLLSGHLSAQKDFGAWTGVDLRLPITKKIESGLEMQVRFDDNISRVDEHFISPYLKYAVNPYVSLGMDYRMTNVPVSGFMGDTRYHRITLDANLVLLNHERTSGTEEKTKQRWESELSSRIRYTHEYISGDLNNDNLRFRLKYSLSLKKLDLKPYVLSEFFLHFNDQLIYTTDEVRSVHRFNKMRLRAGVDYNIKKRQELGLFYIIQPEFESPDVNFILGISYKYEFKRLNKGKKKGTD